MEKPLRVIWFFLLEVLLMYRVVDRPLIIGLFGADFASALMPTRLLLITALLECLSQLVVQPLLAAGKTRLYSFWQNAAAILAAILGWFWIPTAGLAAYLIVRLLYVVVPLIAFGIPLVHHLHEPRKMVLLAMSTITLLSFSLIQAFIGLESAWFSSGFLIAFLAIFLLHRRDLSFITKVLLGKA